MEPHHRRSWQRHPGYSGQAQTGIHRHRVLWNQAMHCNGRNKKRQDIREGRRNWQRHPGYKTGYGTVKQRQGRLRKTEPGGPPLKGIQLKENSKQQIRTMQPSKVKTVQSSAKQRNKQNAR